MKKIISSLYLLTILFAFLLFSCSKSQSPQAEITEYIKTVENYIEKKDAGALKKRISTTYKDSYNNTRQDVVRILVGYFLRNQSVYVLNSLQKMDITEDGKTADITLVAAVANHPINGPDLQLLGSDFYRLHCTLIKNEDWLLSKAELKYISSDDFLNSYNE